MAARPPAGRRHDDRSSTATTVRATSSCIRPSRAWPPCSTGSCRRSAIRSATSRTSACRTGWAREWDGFRGKDLKALGIPSEQEFVGRLLPAGRPLEPIADWDWYVVFAMFRLAAIAQGIMGAWSRGRPTIRTPVARRAGQPLADAGWRIARAADLAGGRGVAPGAGRHAGARLSHARIRSGPPSPVGAGVAAVIRRRLAHPAPIECARHGSPQGAAAARPAPGATPRPPASP